MINTAHCCLTYADPLSPSSGQVDKRRVEFITLIHSQYHLFLASQTKCCLHLFIYMFLFFYMHLCQMFLKHCANNFELLMM